MKYNFLASSPAPSAKSFTTTKTTVNLWKAKCISLTPDGWTSRATQSYITAHATNDDWKMENFVLQRRPLLVSSGEVGEEWVLDRHLQVAVTLDEDGMLQIRG